MDNNGEIIMENNEEKKSVGAGIITMSVLYIIFEGIGIFGSIRNFYKKDETNKLLAELGTGVQITTPQIVIGLITAVIILVSVILILCRKSVGVILFFATNILSIVYGAIISGVSFLILLNLVFPGLMALFIYKKRDIYFNKE